MSRDYSGKRKRATQQYALNNTLEDGALILSGDAAQKDYADTTPVWKQEVTDDRGRKRLHGAFTGGFSAGYFNSVGSKEGWTPSTFVSSRTSRQQAPVRKVTDYMDEEDLEEIEQDQQLRTRKELEAKEESGLAEAPDRPVLDKALPKLTDAVKETVAGTLVLPPKPKPDRMSAPRGGAKALSLMDDEEDVDGFDIGPKIKYDKTLVKRKKASAGAAQHTFQSRKILRNPDPEPEVYRRRSPSPHLATKAVVEQRLLPSIGGQLVQAPARSDLNHINPERASQISSGANDCDIATPIPPWRQEKIQAIEEKVPPWRRPQETRQHASVDQQTAKLALQSTFSPYPSNPEKHARYRTYLEHEAGQENSFGQGDLDPDTYFAECEEFRKCAMMYKPMTGIMSKKFTSSAGRDDTGTEDDERSEGARKVADQLKAARAGKYGHLTRTVEDWVPARLLCKRFELQHPEAKQKTGAGDDQELRGSEVNKIALAKLMPPNDR